MPALRSVSRRRVYLSYEDQSNNYVEFDDFKITHTKGNLVQANEYYPFGLQTANSWTRENTTGNNYLGNGGTELNTTSTLYDLEFRNFDPILGRMHQVDPMADRYSSHTPYNFAFNDPIGFNDPSGADPNLGDPDHVTRKGINQPGQAAYYNYETSTSDFGMRTSDFLANGLHDVVSQWAPDFYGPDHYTDPDTGIGYDYLPSAGKPTQQIQLDRMLKGAWDSAEATGNYNIRYGDDGRVLMSDWAGLGWDGIKASFVQMDRNGKFYLPYTDQVIDKVAVNKNAPWIGHSMVTDEYSPAIPTLDDGLLMVSLTGGDIVADVVSVAVDISTGNYGSAAISAAAAAIPFVSATVLKKGYTLGLEALKRMGERGVSKKMVQTAISKGAKYYDPKNGVTNYILKGGFASGKDLLVGQNPLTGKIATVIRGDDLVSKRFIKID